MYRTGDPRFRRRLNELGQTLENANESAQSGIYIFTQQYIRPCFDSVASCMTTCVDASCPSLNISQRDRLRRQRGRGRSRGRAELNFDFYDDWDDEEDALMGWGNDEFDRLLAGGAGYGTVQEAQPGRQRGMSYPKGRRKSAVLPHDGGPDPTAIPGSSLFGKLFGGKVRKYKPSAAGLQEHPGAKRADLTEGEALLQEGNEGSGRRKGRVRSNTAGSGHTTDSYSSRGDIFPSDEEDDAIPLDDEFAMVLERRTTQSGHASGPETENSSQKTRNSNERRRGKRPSAGSRKSTRHSLSSQSSGRRSRQSRSNSNVAQTPAEETVPEIQEDVPTMSELKQEERRVEKEEEEDVERRRLEAQRLAAQRGLGTESLPEENLSSKEATPRAHSPAVEPREPVEEPSQLPTPLTTDDEDDERDRPTDADGKL